MNIDNHNVTLLSKIRTLINNQRQAMKKGALISIFFISLLCLTPQTGWACSTFCIDKNAQHIVGFNLDWVQPDGLVVVNKRGVKKTALADSQNDYGQPATWLSKYGSITFNTFGPEFTAALGMNEEGLAVCGLNLNATQNPAPDERPYAGMGQYTQYQLDNFNTVKEVMASASQIRIGGPGSAKRPTHFFICDKTGACAVIEFLDGKSVFYSGKNLPVKVLTNTTYADAIRFLKTGTRPKDDRPGFSMKRFLKVVDMLTKYNSPGSGSVVDYAFTILQSVPPSEYEIIDGVRVASGFADTQWSVVFDLQNLNIYFRTIRNKNIRKINLKSFDYSCSRPTKVLDINADLSGNVTGQFNDYSQHNSRQHISDFNLGIQKNFIGLSNEMFDTIFHYPESTICLQ
jgi:penicillin V acylase-like amidase (Ntn superfamily)